MIEKAVVEFFKIWLRAAISVFIVFGIPLLISGLIYWINS